jgi:L-alanine-DL-glutamate epimerase-like enolase superfamily enzyme
MKIIGSEIAYYKWPRPTPITNGLHTYSTVSLGVVKLHTDEGITGIGVSGGRVGEHEFIATFAERVTGGNPFMSEALWSDLWSPKLSGRRGYETRALSAIDFAIWDIKAKAAGLPLYVLLGGMRERIPTYVAGGYYSEGKGLDGLVDEMTGYVSAGARAVKMKVGALSPHQDAARVKIVREAIGPDVRLMVDANCAYQYYDAITFGRMISDLDVFWFEEPVQPDDYEGMKKIAAAVPVTLAAGENEYTKYGFRDLIATQAVGILQPDARYTGGVTEFVKIAALGQAHGLSVCPHGDQQAHLHLMASIPNGLMIEYYPKEFDPMWGRVYLNTPELNSDGTVSVPTAPGNGCEVNEAELDRYRVR